jgi:phosphoribosylanthranilate isomerase
MAPADMAIAVKICGLKDPAAVAAAVRGGAAFLGFVFYPRSPRAVTPAEAKALVLAIPPDREKVAVLVDPDDALLEALRDVPLDFLQLHGRETPERVREVKAKSGRKVIKAIPVAEKADLEGIVAYGADADMLLFDAKPPKDPASLPGGNGLRFDWRLLAGLRLPRPWLLSGGLDAANLADAVSLCRPPMVDVSSGVERAPGVKDARKIAAFLNLAAGLGPAAEARRA